MKGLRRSVWASGFEDLGFQGLRLQLARVFGLRGLKP